MVSSPEVRQGALPPGFLIEREVEPVARYCHVLVREAFDILLTNDLPGGSCISGRDFTARGPSVMERCRSQARRKKMRKMRSNLRTTWIISGLNNL